MANTHETLTSLFTDIADAIREKTGGTEPIKADEFPTAIAGIEAGGGGDSADEMVFTPCFTDDYINYVCRPNDMLNYDTLEIVKGEWIACGNNGLYRSEDGVRWECVMDGDGFVFACCNPNAIPDEEVCWVACGSNGLYASYDGIDWWSCGVEVYFSSVCYSSYRSRWAAAGSDGLYYSDDGANWELALEDGFDNMNSLGCRGDKWVAAGYCRLYYSTDGANWTRCDVGEEDEFFYYAQPIKDNAGVGFGRCSFVATGDYGVYYSEDGVNWDMDDTTRVPDYIYCLGGTLFAGLYHKGIKYNDGDGWVQSNVVNSCIYGIDGRIGHIVAGVSLGGGIYHSRDGVTWSPCKVTGDLADPNLGFVCYSGDDKLWVAAGASGIYYCTDDNA